MAIGLGGIAKGFIVDRAAEVLRRHGFADFVIVAGGDLRADGRKAGRPWRIGIRDPRVDGAMLGWVAASDLSIDTSGDYERCFIAGGRRYHHLIDPATGRPAPGCRSVTVVSRDTGIADALSTGLFVMGPERGLALAERLPDVEALVVDAAGDLHATSGFVLEPAAPPAAD
jgi:thiamine biosynthesis lipoprotein